MKNFLSISELAEATNVSAHTLRYYERINLMPNVERSEAGGRRRYGPQFVHWVQFLRRLRSAGMPIAMAKKYVACFRLENKGWPERQRILSDHREEVAEKITELQAHLKMLDSKLRLGCDPDREGR